MRLIHLRNGILAMQVLLTSIMAWWGIALLRPINTFGSSSSYSEFVRVWPHSETKWAGVFFIAALIGVFGLWARNRWARLWAAVVLVAAHGDLAFMSWGGNGASTGTGTYALLAIFGLWRIWAEGLIYETIVK
jgi:hypothetical protein